MALKSYHKETLNGKAVNVIAFQGLQQCIIFLVLTSDRWTRRGWLADNWYEERKPPLNGGVLPYDGVMLFSIATWFVFLTCGVSLDVPSPQRQKPRMISDHNLDQAIRQTSTVDSRGFRSSIPQPDLESQKRHLNSTHCTSYINHFASSASSPQRSSNAHSLVLTPAGGVGGRNIERGKAASGAMGEVFRVSNEPQRDTHAQRSWMYSTDPMIVAMHQKTHQKVAAQTPRTVADPNNSSKPEHFRRQTTSITTIPQNHQGVFADD